jgi:hypothetical protein
LLDICTADTFLSDGVTAQRVTVQQPGRKDCCGHFPAAAGHKFELTKSFAAVLSCGGWRRLDLPGVRSISQLNNSNSKSG